MARSNTAPAQETNPPDFLAWHVANKGDKGFWIRIGAPWFHRDRKGLSLQLEVGADQWPDRPAHPAGRREEGTGRLAPGLRASGKVRNSAHWALLSCTASKIGNCRCIDHAGVDYFCRLSPA